jgi:cardiolipin synthase
MTSTWELLAEIAQWLEGLVFLLLQTLAVLSVPSVLLRRRSRPMAKLSWLLALFAVPGIGVLAWWLIGRTHLMRKRRRRAASERAYAEQCDKLPRTETGTSFDYLVPIRALGRSIFTSVANRVTLLVNGEEAFPAMERAIRSAEHSINLLFYIFKPDATGRRLRDLLIERARAGVRVRVLVDAQGSSGFTSRFARPLQEAGAKVAWFLPSKFANLAKPRVNFVNHRKILVVDGAVGFTGGMNIGDEYALHWQDMMVQVEGGAVEALQHVFLEDWYFATEELVEELMPLRSVRTSVPAPAPKGRISDDAACAVVASGPDSEAWIHDAYFAALAQARKRIWIATPYFIPSPSLLMALRTSANRGVDVRIVVPATADVPLVSWASRSFYPQLLEAEARIFEYQGEVLHAKAWLVDDRLSSVGTANVDSRSFRLSFEVICLFLCDDLNQGLAIWHAGLVSNSREVTLKSVRDQSAGQKLLESAANLLSPLL